MTLPELMGREGWITVLAASEQTRVSVNTIYHWIRSGEVESTKAGARRYVSVASLAKKLGPVAAKVVGLTDGE